MSHLSFKHVGKKFAVSCLVALGITVASISPVQAQVQNQFITIVNPVRIAPYTQDSVATLSTMYQGVSENRLPATWLITYDVLLRDDLTDILKGMNADQEIGIFLEVGNALATQAGVPFQTNDAWHVGRELFVSGKPQADRIKLIDTVFAKFHEKFGYYPTSVGAWWIDSYSLAYMRQKYHVTANLTCSDQFATDGYQLWGQYWSVPFYPSLRHAGIPASSKSTKLDLVTLQWAARDPYNGYVTNSLYSTQDYTTVGLSRSYLRQLIELYAQKHANRFGQITLGLEGDLPESMYGEYRLLLETARELADTGNYTVARMNTFSQWYRITFPELSPPHTIVADDLLGKPIQTIWYQSPKYRIGLVTDRQAQTTKILDLRTYHSNEREPYYDSPNRSQTLQINIPSLIDSVSRPQEVWQLFPGELVSQSISPDHTILAFPNLQTLELTPDAITLTTSSTQLPATVTQASGLQMEMDGTTTTFTVQDAFLGGGDDYAFRALTGEATYLLRSRKVLGLLGVVGGCGVVACIYIVRRVKKRKALLVGIVLAAYVVSGRMWYITHSQVYGVSQAEQDALFRLSVLPNGPVLVYNQDCLQCAWHSRYKPAVFVNKRNYVSRVSSKRIVSNQAIFTGLDRQQAKQALQASGAKYIYVVVIEEYDETVPFSPGDLGIEKIYQNANATIWRAL